MMIITLFKYFIHRDRSKSKATSNIKIQKILPSSSLSDVGIYLRDRLIKTDIRIISFCPIKCTSWVFFSRMLYGFYGITSHNKLSKFIKKGWRCFLYSEYKIQGLTSKRNSSSAGYCLYTVYLTKVLGIDFKPAVLNSY